MIELDIVCGLSYSFILFPKTKQETKKTTTTRKKQKVSKFDLIKCNF